LARMPERTSSTLSGDYVLGIKSKSIINFAEIVVGGIIGIALIAVLPLGFFRRAI
jgi:hypothetical protein